MPASDPYIFQNFNISSIDNQIVHIENTDKYIVIKNNIVDGQGGNYSQGFVIKNATHITVENNFISGVLTAIDIQQSSNNIISNNFITNLVDKGILSIKTSKPKSLRRYN